MVLPRWTKEAAASALPVSLAVFAGTVPAQAAPGPDLRILSPRPSDALGSATFNIDVSFQSRSGVPIIAAEVWVDGVRWERRDLQKLQPRGVLSLAVDGSTLAEGKHAVVVTVFDATGAASSASINIVAGNNNGTVSGSLSGPRMAWTTPRNGKKVWGTVDVGVDVSDQSGASPYVTFFVDKEFKTLKNYRPYSYVWDTTKLANGWHTIEVIGYVDSTNATTTLRSRVYVDNAGGNTFRMDDIPDLAAARSAPKTMPGRQAPLAIPLPEALRGAPKVSVPAAKPAPVRVARADWARPNTIGLDTPHAARPDSSPAEPPAVSFGSAPTPAFPSKPVPRPLHKTVVAANLALDLRVAVPAEAPEATTRPFASPNAAFAARSRIPYALRSEGLRSAQTASAMAAPLSAAPAAADFLAAAPAADLTVAAPRLSFRAAPIRLAQAPPRYTAASASRSTAPSLATPRATFKGVPTPASPPVGFATGHKVSVSAPTKALVHVAFNGDPLVFDVPPRLHAGLSFAPFRQIFEHTGGVVTWVPGTRVVRGVNADREIVLKVGEATARVNDQVLTLERPAFLDQGRAIVPLSFVGKALDVDVHYDAATGRLQINSK